MRRQADQHEIEDMRPVAWKSDGTPTKFEIVQRDQAQPRPRVIGDDDDVHIVSPVPSDRLPRVQRVIEGDPISEARGFNIRISSLATVLGGGAVLLAALFGASFSAWAGIMIFGSVFALTWAGAFVLDAMTSAGGVELFHALRMWAFLDREQAHRHNRYATPKSDRQRILETVLFAAAVGVTALAVLGLLVAVFAENMPR